MIFSPKPGIRKLGMETLERIGWFTSGSGGAPSPARIPKGQLLFELITEGSVFAPDGKTLCGVGSVFVHRSGEETIWRSPEGGHYACMTAQFRLRRSAGGEGWPRYFPWEPPAGALLFAEEMLHAFHHTGLDRRVIGSLVWSEFCFRFESFRCHAAGRGIPTRLQAVLKQIEDHHASPLGVEDLAKGAGLSSSHLHALFREHLGMTPHQHLILERMRAARHRLATSADPIKSVATAVGYANTESFCRAFKQHSGLTAASYRKKYRHYHGLE